MNDAFPLSESSVIINNVVMTKYNNVISIMKVEHYLQNNISLDNTTKVSFGSKIKDNEIISKMCSDVKIIENFEKYFETPPKN